MSTTYTVSQAARILHTSAATVRRLADDMADILPDYQPIPGQARRLSAADVKTLSALHTRLQASPGQTRSALLAELSRPDSEPLIIPDTLPVARPQERPGSPKADRAIPEAIESPQAALAPFLAAHSDTQTQIAELARRVDTLSADRPATPPARSVDIAALLSVGVLVVGILTSAILQWQTAGLVAAGMALLILIAGLVAPNVRR